MLIQLSDISVGDVVECPRNIHFVDNKTQNTPTLNAWTVQFMLRLKQGFIQVIVWITFMDFNYNNKLVQLSQQV